VLAWARAGSGFSGSGRPPGCPQPQRVAHPVREPGLHRGLVERGQCVLRQRGGRRLLQLRALRGREQAVTPGAVEGEGVAVGRRVEGPAFDQHLLIAQGPRPRDRRLLRVVPVRRAQHDDDLARCLVGQLARGEGDLGRLFVGGQQGHHIGVEARRVVPEAPLVHGDGQHDDEPEQGRAVPGPVPRAREEALLSQSAGPPPDSSARPWPGR
jgi:hypothetical protein